MVYPSDTLIWRDSLLVCFLTLAEFEPQVAEDITRFHF